MFLSRKHLKQRGDAMQIKTLLNKVENYKSFVYKPEFHKGIFNA
ncbi:MAG: hypothetical protein HW390_3045 [Candidatus Brocadiaceae bacterium]|nr:hypothetical protein [Candidatus Brocadiaceae bacterium]